LKKLRKTMAQRLIAQPNGESVQVAPRESDDDDEERDEPDEAPETPPDEPQPTPIQDPPPEPTKGPYVVVERGSSGNHESQP
jgi:hypothetical protein